MKNKSLTTLGLAVLATSFLSLTSALASSITLNFSSAGGTVLDTNGVGTGFTARMPGTGANISGNDTNLLLNTGTHRLTMVTSPGLDFNGGAGVADGTVIGFMLSNLGFHGTNDFFVSATWTNIPPDLMLSNTPPGYVLQPDQLCLVVGVDQANLVRAGFINFDRVGANTNLLRDNEDFGANTVGGGDVAQVFFGTDVGTDMTVNISRVGGVWSITVDGRDCMPNTSIQRNGTPVPPTHLDPATDLFVGVTAMDVFNDSPWTADLVSFSVNVIEQQTAPIITNQPQKQVVNEGNPASFSVTVTDSTASPRSYQWRRNGVELQDQTNTTLNLFPSAAEAGNYTVVITNNLGSVTSSVAPLNVIVPIGVLSLNFTSAGGGILDSNGVGTGFPNRLPGTGTAFPGNDTNLFLDTANHVLNITSTAGDYNGGANEPINESPGVALSSLGFTGSQDLNAYVVFPSLPPTMSFDQAGVYVGSDTNNITRAGWIDFTAFSSPKGKERYSENITLNTGTGVPNNGPGGRYFGFGFDPAILPCTVLISRTAGVWHYYIDNVQWDVSVQPPTLNGASNLTAGVFAYDTGADIYTLPVSNFVARVFNGPSLKAGVGGGNLTISWNVAGPVTLQSNTNLLNAGGWTSVGSFTNSPYTIPAPAARQTFYRLSF
jgi:hypothetical protein